MEKMVLTVRMVTEIVDKSSYFVCDVGAWRAATAIEEREKIACTAALEGCFNKDSTLYCENSAFRSSNPFDFPVGKDWTNKNLKYGELVDKRDGRVYKTIVINDVTVIAQNLNYADSGANRYMMGNNKCYKNDSTNCLKGGRYYSWTAAMDFGRKWQETSVPAEMIGSPHRVICPEGWHIPTIEEWNETFSEQDYEKMQAVGIVGWENATNLLTLLRTDGAFMRIERRGIVITSKSEPLSAV